MKSLIRQKKSTGARAGFTLIEMLVVLAILVLIMSMVGPRILGSRKKANVNAAKSQIGMLRASLEGYELDMKGFPSTEQGLVALLEAPEDQAEGKSTWDGPYINKSTIPKDPWGRDYQYEYPPTHGKDSYPDIWSFGEDGEDNTDDDVVSWADEEEKEDGGAVKQTASKTR
jgi:general secretion pathway protein G